MDWVRILAYITGMVDQELLARNEYLTAEIRILKAQSKGRLKLSDAERAALGEIGHRLGRKVLAEVANVARPDTILVWYRKLVAHKFDGSRAPDVLPDRNASGVLSGRLRRALAGSHRECHRRIIVSTARISRAWGPKVIPPSMHRQADNVD